MQWPSALCVTNNRARPYQRTYGKLSSYTKVTGVTLKKISPRRWVGQSVDEFIRPLTIDDRSPVAIALARNASHSLWAWEGGKSFLPTFIVPVLPTVPAAPVRLLPPWPAGPRPLRPGRTSSLWTCRTTTERGFLVVVGENQPFSRGPGARARALPRRLARSQRCRPNVRPDAKRELGRRSSSVWWEIVSRMPAGRKLAGPVKQRASSCS